jgi:hypothetical protein
MATVEQRITALGLSDAQRMMIEDGYPIEIFELRKRQPIDPAPPMSAWQSPPKTVDPGVLREQDLREQARKEKTRIRLAKLKASQERKAAPKYDLSKYRWDSIHNKFVPLPEEMQMAAKWKVVPYDADGAIIQRGVTSVPAGTEQVQLLGKMGFSFHRCAKGSVKKIIVHDSADGYVREWNVETDNPLPKPDVVEEPQPKQAPGNKAKKLKGDKKAKSNGPRQGGKPGIIGTITELMSAKDGASIEEMVNALAKLFPDRKRDSMQSTVRVQTSRQKATKRTDPKRGTVYSL